jgi:hypothetical protein
MNLVEACIKGDESGSVKALGEMIPRAQPAAIWAILIHAASWHEQRTYDTPHSSIITFAIHRMIEDLGFQDNLLENQPEYSPIPAPDDLKHSIQLALVQRLAQHLAAVDHWLPEKGPRYDVQSGVDSPGNLLRKFSQAMREHSILGAMEGAVGLTTMDQKVRLTRMALSMAAEHPDSLGHGFIMPVSLLAEIPPQKYRHPHIAALWHLFEYMVRKVPSERPPKFVEDEQFKTLAEAADLTRFTDLIGTAIINYGILGHNGILAHRIAYASSHGLIHEKTVEWLFNVLQKNIGTEVMSKSDLSAMKLIGEGNGTDWDSMPSTITLPHSEATRDWFSENLSDIWKPMLDLKSSAFEALIPTVKKRDWSMVRAAQYAMASLYGNPKSSHIIIFTQSSWNLADMGLIPESLAALQVHRMVRGYLKGR